MPEPTSPFQVNLPFDRIRVYGSLFLKYGLAPEIGLSGPVLDSTPDKVYLDWAEAFKGRRITVHAPFMDLTPGSGDPEVVALTRRRIVEAVRVAGLLGAEAMVCHAGYEYRRYPHDLDRWVATARKVWEAVLEASQGTGLTILLENVFEGDPGTIRRVLEELDHPRLGFCLDTGHFNAFAETPLPGWLEELSPWLARLHLHDNEGLFDQHLPIGEGSFDFRALFTWLKNNRLIPGITLEPHSKKDLFRTYRAFRALIEDIGEPF